MAEDNPNDRGALGVNDAASQEFENVFDTAASGRGESGTAGDPNLANDGTSASITTQSTSGAGDGSSGSSGDGSQGTSGTGTADDTAEQRYRTLKGIHKKDKEGWDAKVKELENKIKELEAGKGSAGSAGSASEKPEYELTDQDKELLKNYEKDFDTVSQAEALKRKVDNFKLRDDILSTLRNEFKQAFEYLREVLAPTLTNADALSLKTHEDAVRKVHPDFDTYRDEENTEIEEWIATKPKYLQDAYNNVMAKGTTEEVIDLLTTFKTETKKTTTQDNADSAGTGGTSGSTHTQQKKEQKKEALRGVDQRKTAVNLSQVDTDDYEGAFDDAVKK